MIVPRYSEFLVDFPIFDFWFRHHAVGQLIDDLALRLPRRVVGHFKATGKGYQSRISGVPASYVDTTGKRKAG